jgi:AraC-like DNA-binding protein
MFVCAFWCITLWSEYKKRDTAKIFLGGFMFVAFLLYLGHAAYFNYETRFYVFWESIYLFCSLSVYPFYFLYIKLISQKIELSIKDFWILIPSFLMMVFSFILYYKMSPVDCDFYVKNMLYSKSRIRNEGLTTVLFLENLKSRLFSILFLIQLIPIFYFGRKYISEYNNKIQNYYSNVEGKTLQHFNHLLYIFIATSVASTVVVILGRAFFSHSTLLLLMPSLAFGALLYIIGLLGYRQDFTLKTFVDDIIIDEKKVAPQMRTQTSKEYNDQIKSKLLKDLIELFEKKEIFRQHDLKITDLSKKLNTNRTYISRIVNEELETNFCDLVNNYRVEYAMKLLNNPKNNSLLMSQIAEMSGFTNESSFYRIFKEKKGISPGDYRKQKVYSTENQEPLLNEA